MPINKWWIKKMRDAHVCVCVCVWNGILLRHKKEWNSTFYSNMDGPRVLSEVSQRKTNTVWYHLCVESKIWHKWLACKTERDSQTEDRLVVPRLEGWWTDWKFEVNRCKLFIQTIQQQGPTVKRRELCSVFSDKVSWKEYEKIQIFLYLLKNWIILLCNKN